MNPSIEPRQKKQKVRAKPNTNSNCLSVQLLLLITAIPQFDGTGDKLEVIEENESKNDVVKADEILDSSLDEEDTIPETKNTILCQFQKVVICFV